MDFPDDAGSVTGRKPVALLALLLFGETGSATREFLAGMLWGETDEARARGSLRQTLSELRQTHPAIARSIRVERLAVHLDRDAIETDLQGFLLSLGRDRRSANGPPPVPDPEKFLHGFESIGEGFADWLAQMRVQLRRQLLGELEAAAQSGQDSAARLRYAQAAMALEPLSETACRAAMEVLAQSGDVGQALSLYARFYAQIGEALGMDPSPATQDLAVRIKQGDFDTGGLPVPLSASLPAPPARAPYGQPILALLPMVAMGAEPVPPDLGEMLIEDMICKIASMPELPVLSNVTTHSLQGDTDPFTALRRKHGVRYALRTSIRRQQGNYRIMAQLCSADDGLVLWAHAFDAAEADLLGLQSTLVERLVRVLVPTVHFAELRSTGEMRVEDLSTYQRLLRARQLIYTLRPRDFQQAGALLQTTTADAPDFVPAQLLLADWYSLALGQGWSRDRISDRAALDDALARVLRRSPGNARAQAMTGHNIAIYDRRYDEAVDLFDSATAAMPNDSETLLWAGPTLAYIGNSETAVSRLERAIALSPADPLMFRLEHFLSIALYAAGDAERAAALGMSARKRNPNYASNLRVTTASLVRLGRLDEAREIAAEVLKVEPGFTVGDFVNWQAFQDAARRKEFGEELRQAGLPT
ncbi:MAG: BTAD domain-containing putative transcriptional regulator [Pararhodobacter sp.]